MILYINKYLPLDIFGHCKLNTMQIMHGAVLHYEPLNFNNDTNGASEGY